MMVSLMKYSYMANKLLRFVYQKLLLGEEIIMDVFSTKRLLNYNFRVSCRLYFCGVINSWFCLKTCI